MNKVYRIRINYDGLTKANTAALSTVKILLQSVVSNNANCMTLDIKDFYLMTPLPHIPLKSSRPRSSRSTITQSYLKLPKVCTAYRTRRKLLKINLSSVLQLTATCLFRHVNNGVALFTLVVDDFGVKFHVSSGADNLIRCLQLYYILTIKKEATKYLGLTIAVDKVARKVRISAPGVIAKALQCGSLARHLSAASLLCRCTYTRQP